MISDESIDGSSLDSGSETSMRALARSLAMLLIIARFGVVVGLKSGDFPGEPADRVGDA